MMAPRTKSTSERPAVAHGDPPRDAPRGWVRKTLFQPRVLIALALAMAALVLGPSLRDWLPVLDDLPEYRFAMERTRVTAPHRWAPRDLVRQLVEDDKLPPEVSLLQGGLAEEVASALAGHPWVKQVVAVRVSRSGVTAELEYRIPVLMVEARAGMYPVDRDGTLLPPLDFAASDVRRFPVVRNIRTLPAGPAGASWGDPVVLGAARLADVLAPDQDLSLYWERFQLESIEAPQRTTAEVALQDLCFELLTRGKSRIVWGRPPGADDLEPTVAQKLGRLESYLSSHGSFESPRGPNRIDIRQFDTIEVTSLPADRSY